MRSLAVDLRSAQHPPRWALIILGLLFMIAAALGATAWVRHTKVEALQVQEVELLRQARMPAPRPIPSVAPLISYDASARAALSQSKTDWGPLLSSLESMQVPGVTPVAIEVLAPEQQLRVELEFSELSGLIKYLDELNAGEAVTRWQLVQTQGFPRTATAAAAGTPPTATIRAAW